MAWTIGNRYLSQVEMQGNAMEVYKYFHAKGWSSERYRWNPGEHGKGIQYKSRDMAKPKRRKYSGSWISAVDTSD